MFVVPRKTKPRVNKKKLRKDKRMHASSGDLEGSSSSSGGSNGGSGAAAAAARGRVVVKKTITTDVETLTTTTTTTSLNRWMRVEGVGEGGGGGEEEKKMRTQSCSSIPVEDVINNLAVFRKSFDNVNLFQDESLRKVNKVGNSWF